MAKSASSRSESPSPRGPRGGSTRAEQANTLKPSPALVSFLDRAVARITREKPWTYREGAVGSAPPEAGERPRRAEATDGARVRPRPPRDSESVPSAVRARFVHVGRDYYFEDGTKAFRDHGAKLVSHSENTKVIESLVAIAIERDWEDITVTGTRRFRREAWRQATMVGLTVRGYRPTDFDRAKLVRDLAAARGGEDRPPYREDRPSVPPESSSAGGNSSRTRPPSETNPAPPAQAANGAAPPSVRSEAAERTRPNEAVRSRSRADEASPEAPAASRQGRRSPRTRELSGTLVRHGAAPYGWEPHGEPSYYVTVKTGRRDRTLWGVDLERAVRESKSTPQIGDEVIVRQVGREPVTVVRRERDEEGSVVGEQEIEAERNRWVLEKRRFLEERAGLAKVLRDPAQSAPDAVRQYPALSGAYLTLAGAAAFANERLAEGESRAAFLAAVREHLARAVERGEAVTPPRLRERTVETPAASRTAERAAPALG